MNKRAPHKSVRMVLRCVALLVGSTAALLAEKAADLTSVEQEVVRHRIDRTKQGYVRFRVSNPVGAQPTEFLYETTYDSTRVIQTRRARVKGMKDWGEPTGTIVTPSEYILDHHPGTAIEISKQTAGAQKSGVDFDVLRPQVLGMDLNGADHLHKARLDCVMISPAARTQVNVSKEKREGVTVWRLDYKTKADGSEVTVWIDPAKGPSVVGAEYRQPNSKLITVISCELKQYATGDVWFPSKVVKTLKVDGEVRRQQVVEVEEARFGQPIEASAFTLAALRPKPGRIVGELKRGIPEVRVWDGKGLATPSEVPARVPTAARSSWVQWLLIGGAVGLAFLAVYFVVLLMNRRRAIPA